MLCTTRTPLRVSLFGGGTDYPDYFERAPGAVVGFSINRYIYISALILTAWQAYNYRWPTPPLNTPRRWKKYSTRSCEKSCAIMR